ncbi:MAG: hypothetical protein ABH825_01105 [Candidatus Omnitrophota bacterium]
MKRILRLCAVCCALSLLAGCGPTYPKGTVPESIKKICKKEYDVEVEVKIEGRTLAVYLPAKELFDAVFNLGQEASKKINNVILGISRVALSTDQKVDFYILIAQDPEMPEIEIVYIRYVDDVKRFLLGDVSRDDYGRRAVIALKTPTYAERERILRELFEKLNLKDSEELVKEYIEEKPVSTMGEIGYWDGKFYLKEIEMGEFLAKQIEDKIKISFSSSKELARWFEVKSARGEYSALPEGGMFNFKVDLTPRVAGLYMESGIELGAQERKREVFRELMRVTGKTLRAYRFDDFKGIYFSTTYGDLSVDREDAEAFRKKEIGIDDIIMKGE